MENKDRLDKLIQEGEELKKQLKKTDFGEYFEGSNFSEWITKGVIYLESKYPNETMTIRFVKESEKANNDSVNIYYALLGILKGFREMKF